MGHESWDIIFDDQVVAKECYLDDALCFLKALTREYDEEVKHCGVEIGIRYHRDDLEEDS